MAEPARKLYDDDKPAEPRHRSEPPDGGGETNPSRSQLSPVPNSPYDDNGISDPLKDAEDKAGAKKPGANPNDLKEQEQTAGRPAGEDAGGGGFYNKDAKSTSLRGRLKGSFGRYLVAGGLLAFVLAIVIAILSFLNIFKLDGLMSNIEYRAFMRHKASLDNRSSKWISAYITVRMLDWGDTPDLNKNENTLFRSNRVDFNNPLFDWYKTMRTSKFEQKVFNEHGVKFTSINGADGKIRAGFIQIDRTKIPFNIDPENLKKINSGDIDVLNKYDAFKVIAEFDDSKSGRRALKQFVRDNTHWWEVYKRRPLRKAIQNMTGVTDWRFFEKTRDKIRNKKIDMIDRVLEKTLPETNLMARVVRCFYGLSKCSPNRDVASKSVRIDAADLRESINPSSDTPEQSEIESKLKGTLDEAGISDALKKILVSANIFTKILNIPQTLNMLSYINENIENLVKLVIVARGAQAAGLFQVFETSRDQIKSGEVSGEEVNALMQTVATATSSAGWTQVITGDTPLGEAQTGGRCSQEAQAMQEKQPQKYLDKYGSYAPLCANQQIGNASNAQKIQSSYKSTIGIIVGPIVGAWTKLKGNFITGFIIDVITWFGDLIGKAINAVLSVILDMFGLKDNLEAFIAWVFAKTSNFLGITVLKGHESGGTIFNWLVQGGAYAAESASRREGAALTTTESQAASQSVVALYQADQHTGASLYDRVASLKNPDSLAFKAATVLSGARSNPGGMAMAALGNLWQQAVSGFGSIFGWRLYAATPDGYSASKFAGIETYDYPKECYDLNPITAKPLDGTNAVAVLKNPYKYSMNEKHKDLKIDVDKIKEVEESLNSWETINNSEKFYDLIYEAIGEDTEGADDIAVHIYNCHLLDTAARGGLGYLYGYKKDNADLISGATAATSGSASPAPDAGTTIDEVHLFDDSTSVACVSGTKDVGVHTGYRGGSPVKIRLCALPNLSSSSEESTPGSAYYVSGANGKALVNSRVSGAFYNLVEAAKKDGVTMYANSSFRTMNHQQELCVANSGCSNGDYTMVAKPGNSNHQTGVAVDFGTSGHDLLSGSDQWFNWLSSNASKFGISNYPPEPWHWSPTGH